MPSVSISIDDASSVRGGWRFDRQRDFTGGENKLIIPELVGPNQLISAQNCVLSADGLPETRKGKFRFNETEFGTSGFTSFHRYSKENGTRYLYDGSYVRLKNAEVAYLFKGKKIQKCGIKSLRLYLNGDNLLLWTDMPDDRESNFSGGSSMGAYPTVRRFNLGIDITL